MRAEALGETLSHLPWLAPCAASLVALARPTAVSWADLRADPGCALLVLRSVDAARSLPSFTPSLFRSAEVLATARRHLDQPAFVDWTQAPQRTIYETALRYAGLAERLAECSGRADPELAWVAGLLAPLGWLAVAAVDPEAVDRCLRDPDHADHPMATQRRHWGFDQAAIGRRLARRWRLPTWLSVIVGYLGLPIELAIRLGAEPDLFRIAQMTVALLGDSSPNLRLDVGAVPEHLAALDLPADLPQQIQPELTAHHPSLTTHEWRAPSSVALLPELLAVAEDNRRLTDVPILARLEGDNDELHRALTQQCDSESGRLRNLKLSTLAEFAAGAGHEINNPLAVISGQAQYLLGHLGMTDCIAPAEAAAPCAIFDVPSATVQRSLQTIIGQAQRIHDILNQLMQFARPARPQQRLLDLGGLLREVALDLRELAEQRHVRLVCPEPEPAVSIHADPRQLRMALACLLRNAIEAAPAEGWAGVRATLLRPGQLDLLVEDSGPGLTPQQREHMFDPFYSGRQAGRGRGLGLPTAWRLAREHGGDVYLDEQSPAPTRFVLTLPHDPARNAVPIDRLTPDLGDNPALAG